MTTVKFNKSVKYEGVRHPAHTVFEVKDNDVPELVKIGATVMSKTADTAVQEPVVTEETVENKAGEETGVEDTAKLKEKLLTYSVPELTKFAKERNISLNGKTRKADIYNIIVSTL